MPQGSKTKYSDKQKRQADHIEESYEKRGLSKDKAEQRAWQTVNKQTGGGEKSGSGPQGSSRGEESSAQRVRPAGCRFPESRLTEGPEKAHASQGVCFREKVEARLLGGQKQLDRSTDAFLADELKLAAVIHRNPVGNEKAKASPLLGRCLKRVPGQNFPHPFGRKSLT